MKKIITFITAFILLSITSCRQEENKMDDFREELQGKSEITQKNSFGNLTTDKKVEIWESKLSQVLTQNLTEEQRTLVKALKEEVRNMNSPNYDGIRLIELGIALAKVTPENDYISMVSTLENFSKTKNDIVSSTSRNNFVVQDLENFLIKVKTRNKLIIEESQTSGNIFNKKPTCNCSWTCGMYGGTNDNCNESTSGCGFLWTQPCKGYVGV